MLSYLYRVLLPSGQTVTTERTFSDGEVSFGVDKDVVLSSFPEGSVIVSTSKLGQNKPSKVEIVDNKDDSLLADAIGFLFTWHLSLIIRAPSLFARIPVVGKPLSWVSWFVSGSMIFGSFAYNILNIRIPLVHDTSVAAWQFSKDISTPVYNTLIKQTSKTETWVDDLIVSLPVGSVAFGTGIVEGFREGAYGNK